MVDVVLVGIQGYAARHLDAFLERAEQGKVRIVGVVNPFPPEGETLRALQRFDVPYFTTLESFYRVGKADLVNIASPIQFHCEQTCLALSNGSHVLCEKPIAATTDEVEKMIEYRNKYNLEVAIGYQWAYSHAIQNLKKDIVDGKFGKPIRLKSLVLWPRNKDYYARSWAGKVKDQSGRWVLDSVAANATTHFLQNMFYIVGESMNVSSLPKTVIAETYRANEIENYDTSAIRAFTDHGVEILFLASHTIPLSEAYGPVFEYEFEDAVVRFSGHQNWFKKEGEKATIQAIHRDGSMIDYGSPFDHEFDKIDSILETIQDRMNNIPCNLEVASAQTLCISGVQQSSSIVTIPKAEIRYDRAERLFWVHNISEVLKQCYEDWKLPHELGINWAKCGEEINMTKNSLYQMLCSEESPKLR
ncbi:Gfo/Idh/MocA family protein [Halalkalibacter kiskunsagensis]|uniref:Gfo/Idh/MocA family protein n=1 Tax=Halalkalibacter kiskunsagensis TaxID=1548599 RepID=A0ABV6KJ92_9BACI